MTVTVQGRRERSSPERVQVQVYRELWVPEESISANWAMDMATGIVYWIKWESVCLTKCVYISKHSYNIMWDAATVYLCMCVRVAYYATRCRNLEVRLEALHAFKKTRPGTESHNVKHCGEECGR